MHLNNNQYLLIEYNTPIAIIILIPFVYYYGEFEVFTRPHSTRFWVMQTLAGVVGFVINIAIFLDIQVTSPLTHNLAGTVKAALQTVLAYFIFPNSETISVKKFIGISLIITFSGIYGYVRNTEMKNRVVSSAQNNSSQKDPENPERDEEAKELEILEKQMDKIDFSSSSDDNNDNTGLIQPKKRETV